MKKLNFFLPVLFILLYFLQPSDLKAQEVKNRFYVSFQQGGFFPEYYPQYRLLNVNSTVAWGLEGEDYQATSIWSTNRLYGGFFDSLFTKNINNHVDPTNILHAGYMDTLRKVMKLFSDSVNHGNISLSLYRSVKIMRPAFGQRSTYEAEAVSGTKPGYYFERPPSISIGSPYTDSVSGIFCSAGFHKQDLSPTRKFMVSKLHENNEQTSIIKKEGYGQANYSDVKCYGFYGNTERKYDWYVKPRMRIDTAIANNPNWQDSVVVTIEIYRYDSTLVKEVPIRIKYFKSDSLGYAFKTSYSGEYIEMYKLPPTVSLTITGVELSHGADSAGYYTNTKNSRVDYRVRWNGSVDVWLDYVRLDDEWAHYLFTENETTEMKDDANRWKFHNKIKSEVQNLAGTPGFGFFYFDEFYYNNIECLAKVNELIKQYSNNSTSLILIAGSVSPDLKNHPLISAQLDSLKNKGLLTDGFIYDLYPIYMNTPYPATLPIITHTFGNSFSHPAPDNNYYNDSINDIIEDVRYKGKMEAAASILKNSTTNPFFVSTIQIHSLETNFTRTNNCEYDTRYEFRREPTNQEISVQAYISLCYGAKQISYYNHTSGDAIACGNKLYDWGITEMTPNIRDPRTSNYYGQNKFQFVAEQNAILLKLGRYMYDSLNLKYDDSRSFKTDGVNSTYIEDIKSLYRNAQQEYLTSNDDVNKYWQFGFFNRDNTIEPNTYSRYFMAVNRRCAPEDANYNGDIRQLRVKFRTSELSEFNNWNIIDVLQNSIVAAFNKNSGAFVNIGVFQPGSGRLFKLIPVLD